jgi:hypothetical protein
VATEDHPGLKNLARGVRGHGFQSGPQPPDQSAGEDKPDRNQLGAGHDSAEDGAAAGIIADEFEKVSRYAVKKKVGAENLAIEFFSLEQPHEYEEIHQLDCRFKKLSRFEWDTERRADPGLRQGTLEGYSPEVRGWLAIAATGGEASHAANGVSQSQSGRKGIAGGQRGHVVFADVPGGRGKGGNQTSGENSAGLQSGKAENLARVSRVIAPIIDHIKNLGAENAAENHENTEVPCVLGIDALLLRVADTDPEPDQNSDRDQQAIGRQAEIANVKESREH